MEAPRRKLRGAFVCFIAAFLIAPAYAGQAPLIRKGDCGVVGEAAPPFEKGDSVVFVDIKEGQVEASWIPSFVDCGSYEDGIYAGWTHKKNIKKVYPAKKENEERQVLLDLPANLRDVPEGKKTGSLRDNRSTWLLEEKGDWNFISNRIEGRYAARDSKWQSTRGWIPRSAIRLARLRTVRGAGELVVTPEQLKAYGRSYTSQKICGGHLFTESATFYFTGDSKRPLAVLCVGQLDGESNTLTLLGRNAPPLGKKIEPRETSASIDEAALLAALEELVRAQGQ
jgi:hypothetical protein